MPHIVMLTTAQLETLQDLINGTINSMGWDCSKKEYKEILTLLRAVHGEADASFHEKQLKAQGIL